MTQGYMVWAGRAQPMSNLISGDILPKGLSWSRIRLPHCRESFSWSLDIGLLIVVEWPGWRLCISIETSLACFGLLVFSLILGT